MVGHTLLDVAIADPTRVDLVTRATIVPKHAALEGARQKEQRYSERPRGDIFIPIAIETINALLSQIDEFLRDSARRAFSTMADHPSLLASSSLGFGSTLACASLSDSCAYCWIPDNRGVTGIIVI